MPNLDLELIANVSYVFLLASYIMRDILWLRVLTVISLCFEIPYFYAQLNPLWDGIRWDVAFIAINAYWIARLLYERRPVHFTDEQKRLWQTALHKLQPRHARELFKRGAYKSVAPNETIVAQGDTLDEVALISDGKVELRINGKKIEELGPGHFVGGAMFLDSDEGMSSETTVVAVEPTRLLTWKQTELRKLLEDDNQFRTAVDAVLGLDIAALVKRAWSREAAS